MNKSAEILISIIIPSFNCEKYIAETLRSIENQTFESWECIIIDDGSDDKTLKIAEKFSEKDCRYKVFKRPDKINKGASACRNFGIACASGEYVQYFDSDDLMEPTHLEKKIAAIRSARADAVVSKLLEIFIETGETRVNSILLSNGISDLIEGKSNWYVCGPMWRADAIKSETFPEDVSNLDDLVFNLRCLRRVKKIAYIEEPLIQYIRHSTGITGDFSRNSLREIESTLRAREIICDEAKNNQQYDRSVSVAMLKSHAHLGYLVANKRKPILFLRYLKSVMNFTMIKTMPLGLHLVVLSLFWALTGKGYFLVKAFKQ